MKPTTSLRRAILDPNLLGTAIPDESWGAWRAILLAAMGEALTDAERETFTKLTGRPHEPLQRIEEGCFVIGRRGGKSKAMATLAAYLAGLCEHPLVHGERGVLLCIAPDQRQATIVLDYAEACFTESPILQQLVAGRSFDTLTLTNGISIEVRAASFRRLRGPTYIAVVADEAAFWHSDDAAANADSEILTAVRPGLATTGGPLLIASSPYAKTGEVWETYRKHYGAGGDPLILVAQGASRDFNPSLSQAVVDRAIERDSAAASAEYLAQFRTDLETFISRETVLACVEAGVQERAPLGGKKYFAFVDPSGGSSDSMTCAIGHLEGNHVVVVDCLREVFAPFDPDSCVDEFVQLLSRYGLRTACGDRYAAEWVATAFEKRGVSYNHCELPRSALYLNLLPHLNSRTVRLLDNQRAISQIASLERRTGRGARDTIDHPRDMHDDLANAIAGLVYVCAQRPKTATIYFGSYDDPFAGWRRAQERKRRQFRSRREEAASGAWSAPCTLSAAELAATMPSDDTLRRMRATRDKYEAEAKKQAERDRLRTGGSRLS
jgi:hypothetical protein